MDNRSGEKWAWIGGFFGSTCWILAGAVSFLAQGDIAQGVPWLVLFVVSVAVSFACAPWRNPNTRYWRLTLIGLVTPLGSLAWAIWCFSRNGAGLLIFLSIVVSVAIPVWQQRSKRWSDLETPEEPQQETA